MKKYKAQEHIEFSLFQKLYWYSLRGKNIKSGCSIHYYLQPWFPVKNKRTWHSNQKFIDFPINSWRIE